MGHEFCVHFYKWNDGIKVTDNGQLDGWINVITYGMLALAGLSCIYAIYEF